MALKSPNVGDPRRTRPHPAKLRILAEGYNVIDFARFHGCSRDWAYRVLRGEAPAPERFRRDLEAFLGIPEELLFPEYQEARRG